MSKQIQASGRGAVRALGALLLCVWLVGSGTVHAQVAGTPPSAVNPRSASIAAATEEVLRETSEVRKLAVLHPVKSGVQSRAEIERMLIQNLDEESKPAEIRASELALKKLGLVPTDFQLRPFIIKLLTEQVMGYYDPRTKIFYLADWVNLDEQQPVMAHELTHALQDQHFDLRRFEHWPKGDSDAELAAHALVEGDAMVSMSFYVMRDLKRAVAMMKSVSGGGATEQIDRAPRALRESLLFPYEQGMTWVQQLYKRGGWPQVSQAFTALPQSTEQVLHVDKYFAHEAPIKLNVPDLAKTLGKGWQRIDYDVNGEWNYYQLLVEYLPTTEEAERAAAGWGGDRYAVYEQGQTGRVCLAQVTSWDTAQDAREFYDAYAKRTARRYNASTPDVRTDKQTSAQSLWHTNEGAVVVQLQGKHVLVLEGLPDKASISKLLETLAPQ
ncbi:MAG TPA: hypothetical protein VF525_01605 [Pyrinomonadaceae bacterium]|jgi:hypothetical protein